MKSWIVLIVLSSSLVTGCAGWTWQTKLPFPASPKLTFVRSDAPNGLPQRCLTREGALGLSIFFDELEAFKHAYNR